MAFDSSKASLGSVRWWAVCCWLLTASVVTAQAPTREEKVRRDRQTVESTGYWIYNDLPRAWAEAKETGKPLVVVLRCIPCEECVKLDDELIDTDPQLKPLLEQFVRARVVATNGLDLSIFQFDTDQSWAMFLLNADGTIYGRFGTRSHHSEWIGDVSVEGMAEAMRGALELHGKVAEHRDALAAKRGSQPEFDRPEKLPAHQGKYTDQLDWQGKVVPSCIHCHQIGDAQRGLALSRQGRLTDEQLFPFPHPKTVGLVMNPAERAVVTEVMPGSDAERAGIRQGDRINRMAGQPLLSIADIQWVLHQTPASGGKIPMELERDGKTVDLQLELPAQWRRRDDISWRASTWELRRRALGGLYLIPLTAKQREATGLTEDQLALKVEHAGKYAPHDLAYRAGVHDGDVVVAFDGQTNAVRETDLIAATLDNRVPGDKLTLTVLRDGQRQELSFVMGE
ncbi:MAG: Trx7/PDZ domain-containing (seleno)protein [Pirellulales bacterium]